MNIDQLMVVAVLLATLCLFLWGRWRYDVVSAMAMVTLILVNLVPAEEALIGFGHPAVITVAAVLAISRALRNSGIADRMAKTLLPYTKNPIAHVALLTGLVAFCSAFMNNVGALALMLPVTFVTAAKRGRAAASLLMPLAFGSILGGLITLFGTPPNIIIAAYRAELSGQSFGLFDFTPVGLAIAVAGVGFISLIGWRLIPKNRQSSISPENLFSINEYISEIRVTEGSPLIGEKLGSIKIFQDEEITPVGLLRGNENLEKPSRWRILQENDLIIVKADLANIQTILTTNGLEIVAEAPGWEALQSDNLKIAEVLITRESPLNGRGPQYLHRRTAGALVTLALARQGQSIVKRLKNARFQTGDVLLVQGEEEAVDEAINNFGLLPLAERDLQIGEQKGGLAILVFGFALLIAALGWVSVPIAFIAAITAYVVLDILPVRDLYKDIDWPVVIFLGAMMSVGKALETTGTTELVATSLVDATSTYSPILVLSLIMIITMTVSDLINNAATALIMAPVAANVADLLAVSPDPFLMAVAVGASCAFLTPVGHQSNTLVMGPGGYHFGDYWRMGLPLQIIIFLVALPMILFVWPL